MESDISENIFSDILELEIDADNHIYGYKFKAFQIYRLAKRNIGGTFLTTYCAWKGIPKKTGSVEYLIKPEEAILYTHYLGDLDLVDELLSVIWFLTNDDEIKKKAEHFLKKASHHRSFYVKGPDEAE